MLREIAEQIALDWVNGEEADVISALSQLQGVNAATVGVLAYKEVERHRGKREADKFAQWLHS